MNIDPRGMTFEDWSDRVNGLLSLPLRFEEENWQGFADYLRDHPDLRANDIPQSDGFDHWEDWAMRFNQTVNLSG